MEIRMIISLNASLDCTDEKVLEAILSVSRDKLPRGRYAYIDKTDVKLHDDAVKVSRYFVNNGSALYQVSVRVFVNYLGKSCFGAMFYDMQTLAVNIVKKLEYPGSILVKMEHSQVEMSPDEFYKYL